MLSFSIFQSTSERLPTFQVLINLFFASVLSLITPGLPGHLGQIMPTVKTTTAPSKIASEQTEQKEVTGSF